MLVLHDNARLHTSVCTREAITNFEWTELLHPPYSPHLTLSDYHLLGPFKKSLQGHYYTSEEALQNAMHQWLQRMESNFYPVRIHALVQR